jgi:IMP dehydrogenase
MKTMVSLSYDDVLLVPQYSDIRSRKEIDIGTMLGSFRLDLPVISSPMDTVTEALMASHMGIAGGLGVIHRYCSIDRQAKLIRRQKYGTKAAAIGVTGDFHDRAKSVVAMGAEILCIDVAHGHHSLMEAAIKQLKDTFGDTVHIMAGNVATLEGFNALAEWGANSIRCNIGGGSICSTRIQTGHGVPGLQTIMDCAKTGMDAAIIADGGIRNSGDVVKALAAGADAVMLGSMLAGTRESCGTEIVHIDGVAHKTYRGMASEEAQQDWRGSASSLEGVSATIPMKGSVDDVLRGLDNGIRSGLSYSGARNLAELQSRAKFTRQTAAGISESGTHILGLSNVR